MNFDNKDIFDPLDMTFNSNANTRYSDLESTRKDNTYNTYSDSESNFDNG